MPRKSVVCRRVVLLIGFWTVATAAWCGIRTVADDAKVPPDGLRVFYTGHSFHMFVPPQVEQLVKAAGIQGHKLAGTQGIGGSRVIQHWDLADDKNKAKPALASGEVDVFTMAAHLAIPDDGITNFTELGLKHNPNLRLLVQASWYPFDVPRGSPGFITDNAQRDNAKIEDLQAAVDDWRKKLEAQADDLNKQHGKKAVFIVPVGDAVVKLRAMIVDGKFPGIANQAKLFRDEIGQEPVDRLARAADHPGQLGLGERPGQASLADECARIVDVQAGRRRLGAQQVACESAGGCHRGHPTGASARCVGPRSRCAHATQRGRRSIDTPC